MSIRAICFDIYQTILEVGPPPADSEAQWSVLWRDHFSCPPPLSLNEFNQLSADLISREHTASRSQGILYPEIYWPEIARRIDPALKKLSDAALDDFLFHQAQLQHMLQLMDGAAVLLKQLAESGMTLCLVSNSQPNTRRELQRALAGASLSLQIFQPQLCFWSFEAGFSKPNPHVFRLLTARLRILHVSACEILMVGDRLDNDILPAQSQGWQSWQLTSVPQENNVMSGNWHQLRTYLTQT